MYNYTNKSDKVSDAEFIRRENLNPDDFEEKIEKDFTKQKQSELNNN
jgi:hypothetical protein